MNTVNIIVNWVGPLNVFLAIYIVVVGAIVMGVIWAVVSLYSLFKERKNERVAVAEREEAEALIGADAIPSVMHICLNGGNAQMVENFFHDLECNRPCSTRSACQLAS